MFLHNRSVRDLAEASKLLLRPTIKKLLLEIVFEIVLTAIGIVLHLKREKANRAKSEVDLSPSSRI